MRAQIRLVAACLCLVSLQLAALMIISSRITPSCLACSIISFSLSAIIFWSTKIGINFHPLLFTITSIFLNIAGFVSLEVNKSTQFKEINSDETNLCIVSDGEELRINLRFFFGLLSGMILVPEVQVKYRFASFTFAVILWVFQSGGIGSSLLSASFVLQAISLALILSQSEYKYLQSHSSGNLLQQNESAQVRLSQNSIKQDKDEEKQSLRDEIEWMRDIINLFAPVNMVIISMISGNMQVISATHHFKKLVRADTDQDILTFFKKTQLNLKYDILQLLKQKLVEWNDDNSDRDSQVYQLPTCEIQLDKYNLILIEGKHRNMNQEFQEKCIVVLANSLNDISTFNQYTHKMINSISHDLKTPLNAIILLLDLLNNYIKTRYINHKNFRKSLQMPSFNPKNLTLLESSKESLFPESSLNLNSGIFQNSTLQGNNLPHSNSPLQLNSAFPFKNKSISLQPDQEDIAKYKEYYGNQEHNNSNSTNNHIINANANNNNANNNNLNNNNASTFSSIKQQDHTSAVEGSLIPLQEEDEDEEECKQLSPATATEEWFVKSSMRAASRNHLYHENSNLEDENQFPSSKVLKSGGSPSQDSLFWNPRKLYQYKTSTDNLDQEPIILIGSLKQQSEQLKAPHIAITIYKQLSEKIEQEEKDNTFQHETNNNTLTWKSHKDYPLLIVSQNPLSKKEIEPQQFVNTNSLAPPTSERMFFVRSLKRQKSKSSPQVNIPYQIGNHSHEFHSKLSLKLSSDECTEEKEDKTEEDDNIIPVNQSKGIHLQSQQQIATPAQSAQSVINTISNKHQSPLQQQQMQGSFSPYKKLNKHSLRGGGILGRVDQQKSDRNEISQLFKYICGIQNNSYLLESRINDLIDYSTLLSKKELSLSCTQFSLTEVLLEMKELFGIQAKKKNIALVFPNIDIKIKNDKPRIKQILINILGNAVKFTFEGHVRIIIAQNNHHNGHMNGEHSHSNFENNHSDTPPENHHLHLKKASSHSNLLHITVEDTGIGIPNHILRNLFSFTDHLREVKDDHRQGIGIGLEICSRLCQIVGPPDQQLKVQSLMNAGSKFFFSIYIHHPLYISERDISSSIPIGKYKRKNKSSKSVPVKSKKVVSVNLKTENHLISEKSDEENSIPVYIPHFKANHSVLCDDFSNKQSNKIQNSQINSEQSDDKEERFDQVEGEIDQNNVETVLLVDDVVFNLIALRNTLKLIYPNLHFIEALNGKQAVQKVRENNGILDLIIMDINMPIMDGFQAMQIINDDIAANKLEYVPIIAHTAFDNNEDKQKCFSLGAKGFLPKPAKKIELKQAVSPFFQSIPQN